MFCWPSCLLIPRGRYQLPEKSALTLLRLLLLCCSSGFGMTGRGAQKCDQGFYNPGNNYETCKACGYGYTTTAAGAGLTVADCITDKGYGFTNGKTGECPIGKTTCLL